MGKPVIAFFIYVYIFPKTMAPFCGRMREKLKQDYRLPHQSHIPNISEAINLRSQGYDS